MLLNGWKAIATGQRFVANDSHSENPSAEGCLNKVQKKRRNFVRQLSPIAVVRWWMRRPSQFGH
jgi:hypothetical protein